MNFAKLVTRKRLAAVAAMGGLGLAATSAWAQPVYPDFQVDPSAYTNPLLGVSPFTADKITGNYTETITVSSGGSFDASILWQAGQFAANDGTVGLNASTTGIGVPYGLYGLFQGSGTVTVSGSTATFALASGSLNLYIDQNGSDSFSAPTTGSDNYTSSGTGANDVLVATGGLISGSGHQDLTCATNPNPNSSINCGSFGQSISFALTDPAGTGFFVDPSPFYSMSMQSGQFNSAPIPPSSGSLTDHTNGSLDVVFVAVPEPSTLLILGMGLLGMGLVMRKRGNRRFDS